MTFEGQTHNKSPVIIIVEDDHLLGTSLKKYLKKKLYVETYLYKSSEEFLLQLSELNLAERYFCLITDISLGRGSDGLYLIDILNQKNITFISLVMTGFASIETAISATKKGVFHYLTKPFDLSHLEKLIHEAFIAKFQVDLSSQFSQFSQDFLEVGLEQKKREDEVFIDFVGQSQPMKNILQHLKKIGSSESTVLITGPSGVGKEYLASLIYKTSLRKNASFFSMKCQGIPSEVLEKELFGDEQLQSQNMISGSKGKLELAHQGTLYLDGIGELSPKGQIRLLQVIKERVLERQYPYRTQPLDVRIIASSTESLDEMVKNGKFREDLFYHLNVVPFHIPPLRERREDIHLLISYFLKKFVSANQSNQIQITQNAMDLLHSYDWPGNVKELENVIQRLIILRGGSQVLPEDLPAKIFRTELASEKTSYNIFDLPEKGIDLRKTLSHIEDSLILQALDRTGGNKNKASKLLAMNRTTLIEKMKKKNLLAST